MTFGSIVSGILVLEGIEISPGARNAAERRLLLLTTSPCKGREISCTRPW
jgi:hypothetical protein